MRVCIFLVKVNSRVRRVPKAVHVLMLVYYHDHTNLEQGCHREWPVVPCDNCFSSVWCGGVWWCCMVVVYGGGV